MQNVTHKDIYYETSQTYNEIQVQIDQIIAFIHSNKEFAHSLGDEFQAMFDKGKTNLHKKILKSIFNDKRYSIIPK